MRNTELLTLSRFTAIRAEVPLFMPVTLTLDAGEVIEILGENGLGKSTFLRTIQGLHGDYRGTLKKHASTFYSPSDVIFSHTETLEDGFLLYAYLFDAPEDTFKDALKFFELPGDFSRRIESLSSGQKQRLKLTSLLCHAAPLWLLDEPTVHLDKTGQGLFKTVLEMHLKQGGAALMTAPEKQFEGSQTIQLDVYQHAQDLPLRQRCA